MWLTYIIIAVLLIVAELAYFKIADKFNIIDKPNERSSHTKIVLRGGGIIFTIGLWIWYLWTMVLGEWLMVQNYLPLLAGVTLAAGVSFWDDICSLRFRLRLGIQIVATLLMFWSMGLFSVECQWMCMGLIVLVALFISLGATNFINFMDGINGITAAYSLSMLAPLAIKNGMMRAENGEGFIEPSYLAVAIIGVLVFSLFNFRPKGKAKCFAGDVGSIGIALIVLFALGRLMLVTRDVTYFVFFVVYGADGTMTIAHRIMLHENLAIAHRKHAFQLMANELKMSHVTVSLIYMVLQLVISLALIYVVPDTILAHWIYFGGVAMVLGLGYILFMMKYYHLHEEYLQSLHPSEK